MKSLNEVLNESAVRLDSNEAVNPLSKAEIKQTAQEIADAWCKLFKWENLDHTCREILYDEYFDDRKVIQDQLARFYGLEDRFDVRNLKSRCESEGLNFPMMEKNYKKWYKECIAIMNEVRNILKKKNN